MSTFVINSNTAPGASVRVEFELRGECFAHQISVKTGDACTPLLSADPAGPPVFQELHKQTIETGDEVVFLTGMADHRYWSASVAPVRDPSLDLEFDFACRLKQSQAPASTRYALAEGVTASELENGMEFRSAAGPGCVLAPIVRDGVATCTLELKDGAVHLRPSGSGPILQWGFRVTAS